MNVKITCPNCGETLTIKFSGNKVISITIGDIVETSQNEINKILKQKGIEFG